MLRSLYYLWRSQRGQMTGLGRNKTLALLLAIALLLVILWYIFTKVAPGAKGALNKFFDLF
jgi:hypothetical protein